MEIVNGKRVINAYNATIENDLSVGNEADVSFMNVGSPASPTSTPGNVKALVRVDAGDGSANATFILNGAAEIIRKLDFLTNGSTRWRFATNATAEGGSDAGSDFVINRYSDAGVYLGQSISINRSTGAMILSDKVSVGDTASDPGNLQIRSATDGNSELNFLTNNVQGAKWYLDTNDDLNWMRYDPPGTYIDIPLTLDSSTGDILATKDHRVGGGLYVGGTGTDPADGWIHATLRVVIGTGSGYRILEIDGGAGNARGIVMRSAGDARWVIQTSDETESGSDAGSNFKLHRYQDDGGWISNVIKIDRDTGLIGLLEDVYVEDDIYTTPWTDYSSTSSVTGWSSTTIKEIHYKKIGNIVFVLFVIEGTSDQTYARFTVPYTKATDDSCVNIIRAKDDGGAWTAGLQVLGNGTTTVNLYKDPNGGAFQSSNAKGVQGQFWYEAI